MQHARPAIFSESKKDDHQKHAEETGFCTKKPLKIKAMKSKSPEVRLRNGVNLPLMGLGMTLLLF